MSDQSQFPKPDAPSTDTAQKYDAELANPPPVEEVTGVDAKDLKAAAAERAKDRPLLQKILAVFQKEKSTYRELIINSEPLEKRVALLIDGRLEKFEIERESDDRMVGGIYKGRIKNLDPGLKAAFVDIGYSKNAFLHYWDMLPAATDSNIEVVRVNKKKNAAPRPAEIGARHLGQRDEDRRAERRAPERADAAEHGRQRHQERELEGHHALGIDIGDESRVERAADGGKEHTYAASRGTG